MAKKFYTKGGMKPKVSVFGKSGNRKLDKAKVAYKYLENLETAGITGKKVDRAAKSLDRKTKRLTK